MPTPSGVNYLLQSLQSSLIPQLSKDKNQKWTSSLMSLYLLSLHTHTPLVITHCFLEAAVRTESDANLRKVFDFKYFLLVFQQKIFRIVCRFKKMHYLCTDKSRPLPIRTAYPAGHFLYIDMRYTKQAMTLAQQIQTLQGRGLMIADTNKAEQALDAISYFRLADYWYHLEADHHTHQFLPNSHFDEVLACYYFDKDLKALLFKAIQTIEVAVRSKVIKHFAPSCGPFWFMDATKAVNQRRFQTNLETIKKEVGRSKERYIREHFRKYSDPDLPPVWKTLEVISLGELSKLFNNFNDSQLKHNVAHEFGLNHHKFLSSWLESLTSLRNHCAHHARVWNRAYPLKPATPQIMPNNWITNFTFREESLYAQLCCIAYWLNAVDTKNTFVGDLKMLLLRNPSIDPAMMGFPSNWRQEPLWQL